MFKGITGPGEYRTRDGQKAVVTGRCTNRMFQDNYDWEGHVVARDGTIYGNYEWMGDGTYDVYCSNIDTDIVGHWQEGQQTVNSKRINDIIDSLDCTASNKQKVRELVKEIKPDFETQPEVKAGQVWLQKTFNEMRFVVEASHGGRNDLIVVDEQGIACARPESLLEGTYAFLFHNLEDYFRDKLGCDKKQRGEV